MKNKKKQKKLSIDLLSIKTFDGDFNERIERVLRNVKKGHMVVLDGAIPPDEELFLVERTMKSIKGKFSGIEVCVLPTKSKKFYELLNKMLKSLFNRQIVTPGLTLVGPSKIIKEIKRNPDSFSVFAEV